MGLCILYDTLSHIKKLLQNLILLTVKEIYTNISSILLENFFENIWQSRFANNSFYHKIVEAQNVLLLILSENRKTHSGVNDKLFPLNFNFSCVPNYCPQSSSKKEYIAFYTRFGKMCVKRVVSVIEEYPKLKIYCIFYEYKFLKKEK